MVKPDGKACPYDRRATLKSLKKKVFALCLAVTVGASWAIEAPSRNAPFGNLSQGNQVTDISADGAVQEFDAAQQVYDVQQINVIVPRELQVPEANSYYPRGEIVWRADPHSDRDAQIEAILQTDLARGTNELTSGVPIIIDVQLLRFHALKENTRYSIGGTDAIKFGLSIRSTNTGLLLAVCKVIEADLEAFGDQTALDAKRAGQTQKVRISDHPARGINTVLTGSGGYVNRRIGLFRGSQVNRRFQRCSKPSRGGRYDSALF